jgi:acetyltransferase-like isoleucine patch superfamily enzyme
MRINKFNRLIAKISTSLHYKPICRRIGKKSIIFFPLSIDTPRGISLGNNTFICEGAWLIGGQDLSIGNNTTVGHFSHIVCSEKITIGNNVLIADKVFISDCTHGYKDINLPVYKQPVKALRPVTIGDETWIGENVCIIGCSIGKHCIIGANSVVKDDIPDYSVAAGNPAKVVKQYNFKTGSWEKQG